MIRVRDPILLDTSTYISVAAMALLGISRLPTLQLQLIALALCLTFAVLYRFLFRTNYYERRPYIYFGSQAVVMVMLLLLRSGASDAFNFLFYILTVHAAVVLTYRAAAAWTGIYFAIASAVVLAERGLDGWFAIFFYLVVFIVCLIMGHTIQQTDLARDHNQRLLEELQAAQQKLQDLAVVEERNRVARDLHDSVKQQVFAISMQLSAARMALSETDKAYSSVVEAERLAQQAGAELTTLISALRPPGLESKTLVDAIREHVEVWSHQNKVESDVNIDENVSVDGQVEQALFRVLQESLANVARHSQASKVSVHLKSEKENVALLIDDNGVGFDGERTSKGIGLDSMRERLAAVNGTLEVSSLREASPRGKSQGTRVMATVRRS
jgi:NarL family two-component system sensor histidine kinase LiaS